MSEIEYQYKRSGLSFRTTAEKVSKDWYAWSVQLDGPANKLQEIEEVEYVLHPTFPDRIRRIRSAASGFKLESEGWGEFEIAVNVYFKDGDERTVVVPLKLQ